MGFPFGADEDAAFMTTWLELYRFQGIKKLAKLSKKIDKKFDAKIDLEKIKSSSLINIDHSSLLMKGPGLFDYFYQETKKNHYMKIILNNCIDPIFLIPLAQRLSEKLDFVSACWKNDKNKTIIEDKVFIGSNTSLVAPLIIRRNSKTGAGSVIKKNIPSNSLVVGFDRLVKSMKRKKK